MDERRPGAKGRKPQAEGAQRAAGKRSRKSPQAEGAQRAAGERSRSGQALRHAWAVLAKDLRERLRDRSALLVAVALPLAIAALMGGALADANEGLDMDLGLVATPGDAERAEAFAGWLAAQPDYSPDAGLRVYPFADEAAAAGAVEAEEVDAAVVFPGGEGARVLALREGVFSARGAQGLVDRFLAESHARRTGAPPPGRSEPRSPGGSLRMIDYFAASMSVLFLNFGVLAGVRALQHEKDSGTLARLAAAPVHPLSVLGGKFAGLLATGVLQMAVLVAATHLLFGTPWGSPLPLAALVLSTVVMAVGLTSFFMAVAGDADRGFLLANLAIFGLAIVGGQFMPPQGLPDVFETLQRMTPNGQAARGFVDLAAAAPGRELAAVAEPLLATSAVGLAGIAYGVRRARHALQRAAA